MSVMQQSYDEWSSYVNLEVKAMREIQVTEACDALAHLVQSYEALAVLAHSNESCTRSVSTLLFHLNERYRSALDLLNAAGALS